MRNNACFLITGATGLIGSALVRLLLSQYDEVQLILPVRNRPKAEAMFGGDARMSIVECDLLETDFEFAHGVDYIVHGAAPTSSRYFVEHPVETYREVLLPSMHLLEYAKRHGVKGMVYLSSLEVYGTVADGDEPLCEEALGSIDLTSARSSYPLTKRAVEHLCALYAHEYGVPVTAARLTQTTGAGVPWEDNRVINAFCRSAVLGEDIVLHTTGESARPYCHLDDVLAAILVLLERGVKGETYNVATEWTYISARDLALFIRDRLNPAIDVRVELKKDVPYPPATCIRMSTRKLQALGWKPQHGLDDICRDVREWFEKLMNKD